MVELGVVIALVGLALLVIEAHVTTAGVLGVVGVLGIAGGLGMVLAGSGVSLFVTIPVAVVLALIGVVAIAMVAGEVLLARRQPVRTGPQALIGEVATVQTWDGIEGQVVVDGALWRARTAYGWQDPPPGLGESVIVADLDGLSIAVRRPNAWEVARAWTRSSLSW